MSNPATLKVMGVEIGSFNGWDQYDTNIMDFLNYLPNEEGKRLGLTPCPYLQVDFIEGTMVGFDVSGVELFRAYSYLSDKKDTSQ